MTDQKETPPLQFAPSTFGQKKALPTTPERMVDLRKLHLDMCDTGEDGQPIFPSKTAFVVAASNADYTTREIADTLGMKSSVVYSLIWRSKSGYKPKRKSAAAKAAAEAAAGVEDGGDDEPSNDELNDDELELDDPGELDESDLEAEL